MEKRGPHSIFIPHLHERYQLLEPLGEGGTSTVFRALDAQLKRQVALKVISPCYKKTEAALEEALALSALNHPHIVTVFDAGQLSDGRHFLVMELLEGLTLEQTIKRGVLPESDIHVVASQVLAGLAAAHAAGFLHRDLKPSNLMLVWPAASSYQTKILDFGLAKLASGATTQTMDHAGSVMGSIHYMAPEQFEHGVLDARTDLYQLGCTLYFAATGNHPAQGDTAPEVMAAHLMSHFTPLADLRPDLSPELVRWITSLMARSVADRPANATDALAGLPRPSSPPAVGAPVASHPVHPRPLPGSKRPPEVGLGVKHVAYHHGFPTWAYALVGVLVVAILGGIFFSRANATARNAGRDAMVAPSSPAPVAEAPVPSPPVPAQTASATPQTPPPAAVEVPAIPIPEPDREPPAAAIAAPVLDPLDIGAARAAIDTTVTIHGTIVSVGQSRSGRTRYLNLSRSRENLSIAIDVQRVGASYPMSTLHEWVGRSVTATGPVRDVHGSILLYIEQTSQLRVSD